jgi:hypothetical protein
MFQKKILHRALLSTATDAREEGGLHEIMRPDGI